MKIAVAGATGRVGRHVVDVLEARATSRADVAVQGVDVITGEGLARGARRRRRCVVDAATGPSPDQEAATAFFTTAARNLHERRPGGRRAADGRGVDHRDRPLHRRLQRRQARPGAGRSRRARSRRGSCARRSSTSSSGSSSSGAARATSPTCRRCGPSSSPPGRSPRRSSTWPPTRTRSPGPRPGDRRAAEENLVDMAGLLVARRGDPCAIEGVHRGDPDRLRGGRSAARPGRDPRGPDVRGVARRVGRPR